MDGYDDYMEDYCRRCEGGAGPLCSDCEDDLYELEAELEMERLDYERGEGRY